MLGKIMAFIGNIQFFPKSPFFFMLGDTHYRVKGEEIECILGNLKQGDIILRRFDHYLSGWIIPGFFKGHLTHASLYEGNRKIIHAVAPHVRRESLFSFTRCDRIVVLRPSQLSSTARRSAILKAREYIDGKIPYDFMYNTGDGDKKLYCTELIVHCYEDYSKEIGFEVKAEGLAKGIYIPEDFLGFDLELIHDSRFFNKETGECEIPE